MPVFKPYHAVPIVECGESLISLSCGVFVFADPHPYVKIGAPYGKISPWMLRKSVAEALLVAHQRLQTIKKGWKIKLVDAYRPNSVQAFMVARAIILEAEAMGLNPHALCNEEREKVHAAVFRFWGLPSDDPRTPPPHSTGAAFDCTLVDESGNEIDMGGPVDELTDRAAPDFFASATDESGRNAHANRTLLRDILAAEGFVRHPGEWWHFSRDDQLAVWNSRRHDPAAYAKYGRVDF